MKVLVDSWGWISLLSPKENRHKEVKQYYNRLKSNGAEIITTDYILAETITFLYRRLPVAAAEDALNTLNKAIDNDIIQLEWVSKIYFNEAINLRKRYKDKPDISFTDLTSIAIITDKNIKEVLTDDDHFIQVGLPVIKRP